MSTSTLVPGSDRPGRLVIYLSFPRNATVDCHSRPLRCRLSLIGTLAGMYVLGYSIDNKVAAGAHVIRGVRRRRRHRHARAISLRYLEQGMKPMEAALARVSKEIGFTIISITLSLVAVFIPRAVHERRGRARGREFAVTIAMTILDLGHRVADLDPDDVRPCAQADRSPCQARTSCCAGRKRRSRRPCAGTEIGLRWVITHKRWVLGFTFLSIFASMYMYQDRAQGLLP